MLPWWPGLREWLGGGRAGAPGAALQRGRRPPPAAARPPGLPRMPTAARSLPAPRAACGLQLGPERSLRPVLRLPGRGLGQAGRERARCAPPAAPERRRFCRSRAPPRRAAGWRQGGSSAAGRSRGASPGRRQLRQRAPVLLPHHACTLTPCRRRAGQAGGSAISPEGWRFMICADQERCKIDPTDGISRWYRWGWAWGSRGGFVWAPRAAPSR